jgi:hypothetical protein
VICLFFSKRASAFRCLASSCRKSAD